jgi:Squalene-hopene cyclase C-terminal domain
MNRRLSSLKVDPLPTLLAWQDEALAYFVRRNLLQETVAGIEALWDSPRVTVLVGKQLPNGSWRYPGNTPGLKWGENYSLLETYRTLRELVEMFGFTRSHPAIQKAAEYVFSCQTQDGDIRGILGNQYMPYYHGAILELLIKAGYEDDARVIRGLDWLLAMRQDDGGWIVPVQAVPWAKRTPRFWRGRPIMPKRSRPHAHMATGMVLRAFAAHPQYVRRPEVLAAGDCLKLRLFQPDKYNDRKAPAYWLKFQFPFWWTNLLTALDSLSRLGIDGRDPDVRRGIDWFVRHQARDGLWPTGYGKGKKAEASRHWVGLAISRVLLRFDSPATLQNDV